MEYQLINVNKLTQFERRDLRISVIEKLHERIKSGYNPARPITVVMQNGNYIVADGNHRLKVLKELGIENVPCLIREGNLYSISIECNNDEDTYAPEDLFDKLNTILQLKNDGLTQDEIGNIIKTSRENIGNYNVLINKIVADVLDKCKIIQEGRATKNVANATFNFTLGWFRNSGLYELNKHYQHKIIDRFIQDKCNWNNTKVQQETAKYKLYIEMIQYAENNIQDTSKLEDVIRIINNDTYKSLHQLIDKINDINKGSRDKLICGDSVIELEKLDDASIDLVITDPPYGINYKSNFSKYTDHVTKEGLENDNESAIEIFNNVCEVLSRKTKADSHLYFFIDWKNYAKFENIASKYFIIKTPIVWYKSDAGIGDLQYDWINGTEIIIYCIKGKKPVNKRRVNVIQEGRLSSDKMIHPTQKPESLINTILEVSANKHDLFCDPFMGSGSHVAAAKKYGCNYVGIELDKTFFEKAKNNINE
jgi:DNA modification methylase